MTRVQMPSNAAPIYFTAACLRSSAEPTGVVAGILQILQQNNVVVSSCDSPSEAARLGAIDTCEVLVAEVSDADALVASEIFYALHKLRIPVICLSPAAARSEKKFSRLRMNN